MPALTGLIFSGNYRNSCNPIDRSLNKVRNIIYDHKVKELLINANQRLDYIDN